MGVYIKGMDMPTRCGRCDMRISAYDDGMFDHYECCITAAIIDNLGEKMEDCPLVPVHTPHGRLIDADAFKKRMLQGALDAREDAATEEIWLKIMDAVNSLCLDVDEQPTIIPAEEGET